MEIDTVKYKEKCFIKYCANITILETLKKGKPQKSRDRR